MIAYKTQARRRRLTVACEKCGVKFRLDESKIGAGGAKVRCSKCQHTFVVRAGAAAALGDEDGKTAVYALPVDLKRSSGRHPLPTLLADSTTVDPPRELSALPADAETDDLPVADADLIDTGSPRAPPARNEPGELTATMQISADRLRAAARAAEPKESTSVLAQLDAARAHPSERRSLSIKIASSIVGLTLIAFGVLLYAGGGRFASALALLKNGRGRAGAAHDSYLDVQTVATRSVLYPIGSGNEVLVVLGTAKNGGRETRAGIDAIAELQDASGRVLASERAPLGLALGPGDLAKVVDRDSLLTTVRDKLTSQGPTTITPGEMAPFTVVIFSPPAALGELVHRVRLEKSQLLLLPPAAAPITDAEPDSELRKGKLKGKGKKRKGRSKAVDNEASFE